MAQAAQWAQAERCYRAALAQDPQSRDAWLAFANFALRTGDAAAALARFQRLVAVDPQFAPGHFMLGNLHARAYAFERARSAYRHALDLDPTLAGAWGNLGNLEKYEGRFAEAWSCYRQAIEHERDAALRARRHSNLLLALHYDEALSPEALYAAHCEWAAVHAQPLYPAEPAWPNAADAERALRVGYVSGGLRDTGIVGAFLRGALEHRDRSRFRIHLYASAPAPEAESQALRRAADAWIDLAALDDREAAQRIRADAIDIVVDLDGHAPSGRLRIFAARPAPIAVEWLDWFDTSGVATIDYLLTDPYTTPEDGPQRFVETPWRLPHTRLCYTPPADAPPVAPPPGRGGAGFTYGSFNRQDKLHPALLRVWAEILHGQPGARLLLKNRALQVAAVRDALRAQFSALGIGGDRLELRGPSPHAELLREYGDIDIALDTFPYNGGLTTCECLWMGVPIVALEAERMIGRQSAAMLRVVGLDGWIARSPADYVRLTLDHGRRREETAALRATLRQRFAQSPICDAPRFARDLEAAYRAMWRRYCESVTEAAPRAR
jgi:protein O-GlcNAc transferase